MRQTDPHADRSFLVLAAFVCIVLGVAGCSRSTRLGTPLAASSMSSAPLPEYTPGTTFVYSDGTWEQVETVEGSLIKWVDYKGRPSVGSADFIYPRSEWRSSKKLGERWFEQDTGLFSGSVAGIWPLQVGNSTSFNEYGRTTAVSGVGPETLYDNYWRCSVDGAEQISVSAGTFASWEITCTRYSNNTGPARKHPREYRTWYYAPAVHHWVLELRDYTSKKKEDRRKELVAVMPNLTHFTSDRQTLEAIKRDFQKALEMNGSGQMSKYFNAQQGLEVITTPIKTLKHPEGQVCRQYEQRFDAAGDASTYYGIACRTPEGIWKIPRR